MGFPGQRGPVTFRDTPRKTYLRRSQSESQSALTPETLQDDARHSGLCVEAYKYDEHFAPGTLNFLKKKPLKCGVLPMYAIILRKNPCKMSGNALCNLAITYEL